MLSFGGSKMFKDAKILFLAHYAPDAKGNFPHYDNIHSVYANYHKRIYEILNSNFVNLLSSNDPRIMFNPPQDIDYIFSLYNRMPFRNSEVFISSLVEYHKIAYLGATPNIRALAEDKHLSKMLATYAGVPTPKWAIYNFDDILTPPNYDGPYFVKPRFGAASKFIDESSICNTWEECKKQIIKLHNNNQDVIVEQFIDGIYYTSPVLNNFNKNIFLPCIKEISSLSGNVVTYFQKRKVENGLVRSVNFDKKTENLIHKSSKRLFNLIQPLDYTRFDYIISKTDGVPYFLEFNVCCNLGEHSTLSQAAKSLGYTYENTILNIIQSSMHRQRITNEKSYQF